MPVVPMRCGAVDAPGRASVHALRRDAILIRANEQHSIPSFENVLVVAHLVLRIVACYTVCSAR